MNETEKRPALAEDIEKDIARAERKAIKAITYWLTQLPERKIIIHLDLGIFIRSPHNHSQGKNVEIDQVTMNKYGRILVKTNDDECPMLIDCGEFSGNDIVAILKAVEKSLIAH